MRTIFEEYGRVIIAAIVAAACFLTILFAVQNFNGVIGNAHNKLADTKNGGYKSGEYYSGKTADGKKKYNDKGDETSAFLDGNPDGKKAPVISIEQQARPVLTLMNNKKFYYDDEYHAFPYIIKCAASYPSYYDKSGHHHVDDGEFSISNAGERPLLGTYHTAVIKDTEKPDPNYTDADGKPLSGWVTWDKLGNVFSIMRIWDENGKEITDKDSRLLKQNPNGSWSFVRKTNGDGEGHRQYFATLTVELTVNNQSVTKTTKIVVD